MNERISEWKEQGQATQHNPANNECKAHASPLWKWKVASDRDVLEIGQEEWLKSPAQDSPELNNPVIKCKWESVSKALTE